MVKKTRRESNLALVKGDNRVLSINLPLSWVICLRAEAKQLGLTLDEHVTAILSAPKRRVSRTTKKQTKR